MTSDAGIPLPLTSAMMKYSLSPESTKSYMSPLTSRAGIIVAAISISGDRWRQAVTLTLSIGSMAACIPAAMSRLALYTGFLAGILLGFGDEPAYAVLHVFHGIAQFVDVGIFTRSRDSQVEISVADFPCSAGEPREWPPGAAHYRYYTCEQHHETYGYHQEYRRAQCGERFRHIIVGVRVHTVASMSLSGRADSR